MAVGLKERKRAEQARFYAANPRYRQAESLKRYYGISLDEYDAMQEKQGGLCAACRQPESRKTPTGGITNLHVDHDHVSGRVRGLLCNRCNFALGYAKENPQTLRALANYIEGF